MFNQRRLMMIIEKTDGKEGLNALAADGMRSAGSGRARCWNIKSRGGREGDCNGGPEIVFADSHCFVVIMIASRFHNGEHR